MPTRTETKMEVWLDVDALRKNTYYMCFFRLYSFFLIFCIPSKLKGFMRLIRNFMHSSL